MKKEFWIAVICAWLIFIAIDFFFHATILVAYWNEDLPALKDLADLAFLIPIGYGSFFFLTLFIGWIYYQIFNSYPGKSKVLGFAFVFAGLFAVSNFLGLLSYIELPVSNLTLINLVYFVEILAVIWVISLFQKVVSFKKLIGKLVLWFFLILVFSIILQNIFQLYPGENM
ncbi:MAG: hypothetical protein R3250_11700 [Melioribacteraceae bacterium]|nr:hypothetical protein [Melioribacteraceae bacterium]